MISSRQQTAAHRVSQRGTLDWGVSARVWATGVPSSTHHCTSSRAFGPFDGSGRSGRVGRGRLDPQLGYGDLAHSELLDLAGDRHREVVGETDISRDLVVGDTTAAETPHVVLGHLGPRPNLDPGHDLLAEAGVRHADHLDVADVRMAVQELLDLPGVDVLPTPDDHVLDATHDADVAVAVHRGHVAGVHPPFLVDDLVGALAVVPVADHHRVAASEQFARGVARECPGGDRVDDLD